MNKIDLSYLQSISGGDNQFVNDMLNMFLQSTFPEIDLLKKQAYASEWEGMSSTAHKMKAPIQMLGIPEVSALVLDIELCGRNKENTELAVSKVLTLEKYIESLKAQIEALLKA